MLFNLTMRTSIILLIFILSFTIMAEGAEFKIESTVLISEEYTDNAFLKKDPTDEDYITRALPSITMEYKSPIWEWDISYALDYRHYGNYNYYASWVEEAREVEATHDLNAKGHITMIKEFLFINISDEYRRVSLDATRDYSEESRFLNQSDRNIFTVNPYFVIKPDALITLTTGYIYSDTEYKDVSAIDKVDNIAYVESEFELSPKMVFNLGYKYTQGEGETSDYDKNDAYYGVSYEYIEGSHFLLTTGNSWLDFDRGGSYSHIFWNVSITHKFSTVTGSLESAVDYDENPQGNPIRENRYSMSLGKPSGRTTLNLSISLREYRDSETEDLQTKSYGITGNLKYELTSRTAVSIGSTAEEFKRESGKTYTNKYLLDLRFDHILSDSLNLALEYKYTDSYSPKTLQDNYMNNRFIVEIKKSL